MIHDLGKDVIALVICDLGKWCGEYLWLDENESQSTRTIIKTPFFLVKWSEVNHQELEISTNHGSPQRPSRVGMTRSIKTGGSSSASPIIREEYTEINGMRYCRHSCWQCRLCGKVSQPCLAGTSHWLAGALTWWLCHDARDAVPCWPSTGGLCLQRQVANRNPSERCSGRIWIWIKDEISVANVWNDVKPLLSLCFQSNWFDVHPFHILHWPFSRI